MSKAPKNIEKILLGVAGLAACGLIYLGVNKGGQVEEDFQPPRSGSGASDTEVKEALKVTAAKTSQTSDRKVEAAKIPSDKLEGGVREVDLFTGIALFANREDQLNPVDLVTSDDVHDPIPNVWWLKHNVSPQFADSPQRDHDNDGFSNLEEFEAGTVPSDKSDHPPLVAKLSYVGDESERWIMEFGFEADGKWIPRLKTGPKDKGPGNRVGFADGLEPGGVFFVKDPMKGRFKFIKIEERKVRNKRLNIDETLRFGIYEDQSENKKGMKYEVPNRMPRAQREDFAHYDRTAILDLRALGKDGQNFKIKEMTHFSLPNGQDEKPYFLKQVTPENIVVSWKDGEGNEQEVTIPKGGLPKMNLSK